MTTTALPMLPEPLQRLLTQHRSATGDMQLLLGLLVDRALLSGSRSLNQAVRNELMRAEKDAHGQLTECISLLKRLDGETPASNIDAG